jgi:hypothetical protein
MWDVSVPPGQHPVKMQSAKFKYIYINFEITHSIYQIKATVVVNPANMSDLKNALRWKQTMLLFEDSTPVNKEKSIFQPCRRDTKCRNKNIIHALPLTSWSFLFDLIPSISKMSILFGAFEKHRFQLAQCDADIMSWACQLTITDWVKLYMRKQFSFRRLKSRKFHNIPM